MPRQACEGKGSVSEGNEKFYFSEHMNDKKEKQTYCCYGKSFNGLDRWSNQPQDFLKPKPDPEQGPELRQVKKLQRKSLKLAEVGS